MFAFYESDWFTIALEIFFLLFIAYDAKRYFQTRKREYLLNILLAVVFFFWALVPFYNKYFTWQAADKRALISECSNDYNASYCSCLEDKVFKEYDFETYRETEKTDEDFLAFLQESDKECRGEGSWF